MTRDDVPERLRRLYDRAMTGKSRNAAVRAFCCMCVGWKRVEVDRCSVVSCPLYPYRPKTRLRAPNSAKPRRGVPKTPPGGVASKRERAQTRLAGGSARRKVESMNLAERFHDGPEHNQVEPDPDLNIGRATNTDHDA